MAFKIALTPTYLAKVEVNMPKESGGFESSDFWAKFKRVDVAELEALRALPQKEVIGRVLVGWTDLLDEESRPVEYGVSTRAALLLIPQVLEGLVYAFWTSIYKAREKN